MTDRQKIYNVAFGERTYSMPLDPETRFAILKLRYNLPSTGLYVSSVMQRFSACIIQLYIVAHHLPGSD